MFAYCLCNPINLVDRDGKTAEALQVWTASMWWLCAADTILPIGDIVYGAGIIILAATATHIASKDNNHTSQLPKTSTIVNCTTQMTMTIMTMTIIMMIVILEAAKKLGKNEVIRQEVTRHRTNNSRMQREVFPKGSRSKFMT